MLRAEAIRLGLSSAREGPDAVRPFGHHRHPGRDLREARVAHHRQPAAGELRPRARPAARTDSGKPASRQAARSSSDSSHQASWAPCPAWAIALPADISSSGVQPQHRRAPGRARPAAPGRPGRCRRPGAGPGPWASRPAGPAGRPAPRPTAPVTVMPGSASARRHSAPRARRTTLRIRASCQSRIACGPLAVPGRPLVAKQHQHRAGRRLQRVRTRRGLGPLDARRPAAARTAAPRPGRSPRAGRGCRSRCRAVRRSRYWSRAQSASRH